MKKNSGAGSMQICYCSIDNYYGIIGLISYVLLVDSKKIVSPIYVYILLPLFLNIRCFSFVKQMHLDIF
jgi:hypothetical protein